MTNQQVEDAIGGYEESPYICPICKGYADNGHDRCLPPNAYVCTKCTESPAVQAEVGGGSNSQDDPAKPAPASPLPSVEDVADVIQREIDYEAWCGEVTGHTEAAQALQSLYREHFAGWLEGEANKAGVSSRGLPNNSLDVAAHNAFQRVRRLLLNCAKVVRESGE